MTCAEFINSARGFLGTPFAHQGRVPGIGLDCAGLVVAACRENNYQINDVTGYSRLPSNGQFTNLVLEHCTRIELDEVLPGDVMMFRFREEAQHIAIISRLSPLTIIHCHSSAKKVIEVHFNNDDTTMKLSGCYRLKGLF